MDAVTCKCYLSQHRATSCADGPIGQKAPVSKPTESKCSKVTSCSHQQRWHFGIVRPERSAELDRQGSPGKVGVAPEELSETSKNVFSKSTPLEQLHAIIPQCGSTMLELFFVTFCGTQIILKPRPCLPSPSSYFYLSPLSQTEPLRRTLKRLPS